MKMCPNCFSSKRTRKKRRGLLKLVLLGRRYECGKCGTKYLYIELLDITFKLSKPSEKKSDLDIT